MNQLLHQVSVNRSHEQSEHSNLIYEIKLEKFSLKTEDFNQRCTKSRLCFLQLDDLAVVKKYPQLEHGSLDEKINALKSRSVAKLTEVLELQS